MANLKWNVSRDDKQNWILKLNTKEYVINSKFRLSTEFGVESGTFITIETPHYSLKDLDTIQYNYEDETYSLVFPDNTEIHLWDEDRVNIIEGPTYFKVKLLIPIIDLKDLFSIGSEIKTLR